MSPAVSLVSRPQPGISRPDSLSTAGSSRIPDLLAAGCRPLGHLLDVLEDRVDLPAIPVRIGNPELLLQGIAAGLSLLVLGGQTALRQDAFPVPDLSPVYSPGFPSGRGSAVCSRRPRAAARDGSRAPRR